MDVLVQSACLMHLNNISDSDRQFLFFITLPLEVEMKYLTRFVFLCICVFVYESHRSAIRFVFFQTRHLKLQMRQILRWKGTERKLKPQTVRYTETFTDRRTVTRTASSSSMKLHFYICVQEKPVKLIYWSFFSQMLFDWM